MPKIVSFVVYLLIETDSDAPLRGTLRAITDDSTHLFGDGVLLLEFLREFRRQASAVEEATKNHMQKLKGEFK